MRQTISFKAKWAAEFPTWATKYGASFYTDGTKTKIKSNKIKMMRTMQSIESLKYYQTEKFKFLKIPYIAKWCCNDSDVKNLSYMLVALPKSHNDSLTCDEFNEAVDMLAEVNNDEYLLYLGDEYDDFTHENVEYKIDLKLPKFELKDQSTSLKYYLKQLGVTHIFKSPDMGAPGFVGDVFHTVFLKVNEKGTEAAEIAKCSNKKPPRIVMIQFEVDHPFYVAIMMEEHQNKQQSEQKMLFLRYINNIDC